MSTKSLRIGLVGAGLIGRRHAGLVSSNAETELSAIADPSVATRDLAAQHGAKHFASLEQLLSDHRPDGIILATPNALHAPQGLTCAAAGIPMLIEKPIAHDTAAARTLLAAAEKAGVAILVGHHRRHNPIIAAAKAEIDAGRLGQIVSAHGQFWLYKPDDYFEAQWRRKPGAGPVLINLIHDIDLLRHLCGDIVSVQAVFSDALRGFDVEDTAAAILTFQSGAIGTLTASDTVVAPWSWELTAGENPAYHRTDQHCYLIGGTHGSLSLPQGMIWTPKGPRSWWEPLDQTHIEVTSADPLVRQLSHFCQVIRGEAAPLVSGRDGLVALEVLDALKRAASTKRVETPGPVQSQSTKAAL